MQKVQFEAFDGPLDLLLSLLAKNEIDIYDIPIAEITDQYMEYLYEADELNIELASEFIVVAAQLIEIKTKMMLPKEVNEDEEAADPREELIQRLLEYKVFKQISAYMKRKEPGYQTLVEKDPEYFPELMEEKGVPDVTVEMLLGAIKGVYARHELKPEETFDYTIHREEVSVEDMMLTIAEKLEKEKSISFFSIFEKKINRYYIIAAFLAVLELVKDGIVTLSQEEEYGDITIERV